MAANNNLTDETNDLVAITNSKLDILIGLAEAGGVGVAVAGGGVGRFTAVRGLPY
jgi:hypothetical protein